MKGLSDLIITENEIRFNTANTTEPMKSKRKKKSNGRETIISSGYHIDPTKSDFCIGSGFMLERKPHSNKKLQSRFFAFLHVLKNIGPVREYLCHKY